MRMDLPDGASVPLTFDDIEVGDYLGSRQFPSIHGRALRTCSLPRHDMRCVIIETPFRKEDVLFEGEISVLGFADLYI